jgi:hypothetical protein
MMVQYDGAREQHGRSASLTSAFPVMEAQELLMSFWKASTTSEHPLISSTLVQEAEVRNQATGGSPCSEHKQPQKQVLRR